MSKGTRLLMLPVGLFLNGYTLSVLWSWFVATKFGLPTLTIVEALGLAIVVGYFTSSMATTDWGDESDKQKTVRIVLLPFLKTGVFLGIGWVILQFS